MQSSFPRRLLRSPWLYVAVGAGALLGWSAGSAAIGALAGAALGIPAGIFVVYRRYRDAI